LPGMPGDAVTEHLGDTTVPKSSCDGNVVSRLWQLAAPVMLEFRNFRVLTPERVSPKIEVRGYVRFCWWSVL